MAGEIIRPADLTTERTNPVASEYMVVDNGVTVAKSKISDVVLAGRPSASQAEAEAGTDPLKAITPLTAKQAIQAQGDVRFASAAQGAKADSAVQSIAGGSGIDVDATDPQHPVITYTGAGVVDGNKGDLTVSGAGTAWQINPEVVVPSMLKDEDAKGFRMAANVRGRVNFFDFLQETRSSAVREQIMNGTFTGDLAVEWQAFRDALQAISTAGGRPYGFIPECKIYSSVAPNFAMDFLCLDTQGLVDIVGLGSARGFNVDGMGLGAGNYGVRDMRVGPLRASSEAGSRGAYIRRAHWSEFNGLASLGATFAAITVDGCVSTNFSKPLVSNQKEPFIVEPSIGLLVTGTAYDGGGDPEDWKNLIQTSWSKFDLPIIEWMPIGIILEHTYGNSIVGGTAEGCSDIGIQVSEFALYNKVFGTDFEVNTNYDMDIQGSFNEFYGVDCQTIAHFRFATSRGNKIFGGHFGEIRMDSGASRNLVTGANVNTITDTSTGATRNRFHNIADNAGGWSDKWTSWTPVVTSLLGTLTSYTAEGFYRIIDGDTVEVTLEISITNNGTGAGAIVATLPFAAAVGTILSGAEVGISAKSTHGNIPSGFSEVTIRAADGTYPGANGAALRLQGVYRRI